MAKLIFSNRIPFKGYKAMAIFPFVFVRKEYKDSNGINIVINHENIHIQQQKEVSEIGILMTAVFAIFGCGWWSLLALPLFYWWYLTEYFIRFVLYGFNHSEAYRNISFEQEAYTFQKNENYLKNRRYPEWLKFLPRKMYSRWPCQR